MNIMNEKKNRERLRITEIKTQLNDNFVLTTNNSILCFVT